MTTEKTAGRIAETVSFRLRSGAEEAGFLAALMPHVEVGSMTTARADPVAL